MFIGSQIVEGYAVLYKNKEKFIYKRDIELLNKGKENESAVDINIVEYWQVMDLWNYLNYGCTSDEVDDFFDRIDYSTFPEAPEEDTSADDDMITRYAR